MMVQSRSRVLDVLRPQILYSFQPRLLPLGLLGNWHCYLHAGSLETGDETF